MYGDTTYCEIHVKYTTAYGKQIYAMVYDYSLGDYLYTADYDVPSGWNTVGIEIGSGDSTILTLNDSQKPTLSPENPSPSIAMALFGTCNLSSSSTPATCYGFVLMDNISEIEWA